MMWCRRVFFFFLIVFKRGQASRDSGLQKGPFIKLLKDHVTDRGALNSMDCFNCL